jgi:hypothetical protein
MDDEIIPERRPGMSDKNIYQILESLDAAQRGVKQLPALFKPQATSPQLSGPYPGRNATQGYLVGEGDEQGYGSETGDSGADETPDGVSPDTQSFLDEDQRENPMRLAVTRRIVNQHPEWITRYGVEFLMQAIDDATEGEDDWEEIGSSDISAYVNMVHDRLKDRMGSREEMDDRKPFAESATTEDVISTVKKKLGDYLSDLTKEIKSDPDLKDKLEKDKDQIGPAVKTIRTDDGHEIKIHGNEDDGFRITIKDKQAKTKFSNLDEAVMACEMYCARRRGAVMEKDYLEER